MGTRWSASASAASLLPEYPRPQLTRDRWQNLNGQWDYAITTDPTHPPATFSGKILVPFPLESRLSGVEQRLDARSTLWYRRQFVLPADWRGQHVQLHFGAVDWAATVFLNGRQLTAHHGGYDAFSADLTAAANWDGTNELLVAVMDPTEGDQPRGKQSRKPEGIFYTPSSGIWQTVWLEPVPPLHVGALRLTPNLAAHNLRATIIANTFSPDVRVEISASVGGQDAGSVAGEPGAETTLPLKLVRPWSPAEPTLYDLVVRLRRGNDVLDEVHSYFGLREIRLGTDRTGARRLFLNGQPLFQFGVLDQGFWPDGLYTAPSDEALRFDIMTVKQLGFNLIRKHVKVEPERWYYWADRLGVLVWQDMPSGNNATEAGRRQFETELLRMVEQRANHPSIVLWVLFNEGWGQFDTERLVRRVKTADPSRLVDNASGWTDLKLGDVMDLHSYPGPLAAGSEIARASVLGEFGGLGLGVRDHTWSRQPPWGYQITTNAQQLTRQYGLLVDRILGLQKTNGLAAAVYTQLTDVETECNGFLTYDRDVMKIDPVEVRRVNQRILPATREQMLLPNAVQGSFAWSYVTNKPAADWMQPSFDASAWSSGPGGFGTPNTPGAIVNTLWNTSDIWLRREFNLEPNFTPPLALVMNHDEDAEVYLNGVPAASAASYLNHYQEYPIYAVALQALHAGRNVMAIHCHQTVGGQYIDAGLLAQPAAP